MHSYFRNHQLYLAEKFTWMERQITKTSKRSLLKIESLKLIETSGESDEQLKLVEKLVKDSLLNPVKNKNILQKEGFYNSNLSN